MTFRDLLDPIGPVSGPGGRLPWPAVGHLRSPGPAGASGPSAVGRDRPGRRRGETSPLDGRL